jgi:pyrroloquinoline quinone biosynthesis protein B
MLKCWLKLILLLFLSPLLAQKPFVLVLGITQDGGYPHLGCTRVCCTTAILDSVKQMVVSLAVADPTSKQWWLFEATPDITEQLQLFKTQTNGEFPYLPEGIFLSHAHMGHYTGHMYLGREVMNTKNVSVYALPKMKKFLTKNGPWCQLISLNNITLKPFVVDKAFRLSANISVTAITVPHRDEFSETAGFKIETSAKNYLFIPDIDKWQKWDRNVLDEVKKVDVGFLDATFYSGDELPGRDIREVPHPLVTETLSLFNDKMETSKIHFIHFNHTNPLLWDNNTKKVFTLEGYHCAIQGERY